MPCFHPDLDKKNKEAESKKDESKDEPKCPSEHLRDNKGE